MNLTMTNSRYWLPHLTVDYDTCLWSGLRDKIFWDVNWVMGCTLTIMGKIEGEWKCTTI